jgi:hypothetical protein
MKLRFSYGDRVQIRAPKATPHPLTGLDKEFEGSYGAVVDMERGIPTMYRVKLDRPVFIAGVGMVRDDLWHSSYLKKER